MRTRLPHVLRALPLAAALAPGLAFAQQQPAPGAAPATPAPQAPAPETERAPQGSPIETFDLGRALVSDTGGLTADQAAKRAVANNPQIMSAQASANSAEWDAKSAWSGYLPQVTLFAQYKRINQVTNNLGGGGPAVDLTGFQQAVAQIQDPATQAAFGELGSALTNALDFSNVNFTQPLNNYSLGVGVKVPISDIFLRIMPAYEGQLGIAQARKLQAEAIESGVDLQARAAFYQYAGSVAARIVAEQAVKQAEAQAAQIKLFVDAGTSAPVDLMTATARLEGMRGALANAVGQEAIARNQLSIISGIPESEIAAIGEPVMDLPPAPTQPIDELVNRALERRAEARALRKVVGASDSFHKAQRNSALPQLVLEANDLYANPNPRYIPPVEEFNNSWDVGASLVWSPNNSLTGYQAGQKTKAELAKARADLAGMENQIRTEVVSAYQNFKAAEAGARSTEAQLAAAEEAYRVRLAMYRVGAGVIVDLLNADFAVTEARIAYVRAALGARQALAALERAAVLRE